MGNEYEEFLNALNKLLPDIKACMSVEEDSEAYILFDKYMQKRLGLELSRGHELGFGEGYSHGYHCGYDCGYTEGFNDAEGA